MQPSQVTATRQALSIRRKIYLAFLAMAAVSALFGWSAVNSITGSGRLVVEAFDRTLMAVKHTRAAQATFETVRAEVVDLRDADDAAARRGREESIVAAVESLLEDLEIARARSQSMEARAAAVEAVQLTERWTALAVDPAVDMQAVLGMARVIADQLEILVNIVAGDAFRGRQSSLATIAWHRHVAIIASLAVLTLSAITALLLARRIVGPVAAASDAAARIAMGELDISIPRAGNDELGQLLRSMAIMRDNIRAMVERERGLRRSAQIRLLDAIEGSREGVVLVDGEGAILLANSQAKAFLPGLEDRFVAGVRYADLLAAAVALRRFHWDSMEESAALRARLAADGSGADECRLADGRWLRLSRSVTREGGFVAIWSEITVLKERETILRDARDRAEAASRAKTEFLANMSHELRTPLNAVIGFSEMMEAEMLGPIGLPKYKEFAGDILRSGRHLLAIINDILSLAKSEAGRLALDVSSVDLADTVATSSRLMSEASRTAGVDLSCDLARDLPVIEADPVKVKQVLLNLLSNAIKFTPTGGSVRIEAGVTGAGVAVIVRDSGIGMAPEEIPIALAPFGQVDSRLARKYEGTGLGLPLTKAFVELHGGTLAIASARGVGTAVTVTFPLSPPARRAA